MSASVSIGNNVATGANVAIEAAGQRLSTYIIGKPGTGKSALLERIAYEDTAMGMGSASLIHTKSAPSSCCGTSCNSGLMMLSFGIPLIKPCPRARMERVHTILHTLEQRFSGPDAAASLVAPPASVVVRQT
jgi:hypothetical protein